MNSFCSQVLDSDQVIGLSIYWRSVNEDSLQTLSVLQSGPPSLGFIVTGLHCYTKYQFFLVPFNNNGEGKPSNIQGARTLADGEIVILICTFEGFFVYYFLHTFNENLKFFVLAPSAPPSQLEAKFLNISTVSITWSPPPSSSHNGLIQNYEV